MIEARNVLTVLIFLGSELGKEVFLKMRPVRCTLSFEDAYGVRTVVEEKSRDAEKASTMIGRDFCLELRSALAGSEWNENLVCFDGAIEYVSQPR